MKWKCCMMVISDRMEFCCSSGGCRRSGGRGSSCSRSFLTTFDTSIAHQFRTTSFFQFRCTAATVVIIPYKGFHINCINRQQLTDSWPLLNLNSISEILNSSYRTLDWPKQALNQKIEAVTATLSFKTNLFNKIVWNSNKNIQKTEKSTWFTRSTRSIQK